MLYIKAFYPFLSRKMKKLHYTILLSTFAFSLLPFTFHLSPVAAYEIKLDLTEKKVYLISGSTQISVDNVEQYFS